VGGIENGGWSIPRTRKSHPSSVKAKVAIEAIKAPKTTAHITQMLGWVWFARTAFRFFGAYSRTVREPFPMSYFCTEGSICGAQLAQILDLMKPYLRA
jgi:hypothetical protein